MKCMEANDIGQALQIKPAEYVNRHKLMADVDFRCVCAAALSDSLRGYILLADMLPEIVQISVPCTQSMNMFESLEGIQIFTEQEAYTFFISSGSAPCFGARLHICII